MAFDPTSILTTLAAPSQTSAPLGPPRATSPAGGGADTAFDSTAVLTALAGRAPAPGSRPPEGDFDAHSILTALASPTDTPR
jgi:hypothetical protein